MNSNRQSGQASTEYMVVAGALGLALFYPFLHQGPVFVVLVHALMNYFRTQSFVMSIL